jgi:hypothetical protein
VILTLNIGHQAVDHHSEPEIGDERQLATNRKKSSVPHQAALRSQVLAFV